MGIFTKTTFESLQDFYINLKQLIYLVALREITLGKLQIVNLNLPGLYLQWRIQDFPLGGGGAPTRWGGRQPLTHTLFSENVCENERN